MFVLNRKKGERFLIVGGNLRAHIKILNVKGDRVRLGIRVLAEVPIRPTNNEPLPPADMSGEGKQKRKQPRRSRGPRRVWPPMEDALVGRY